LYSAHTNGSGNSQLICRILISINAEEARYAEFDNSAYSLQLRSAFSLAGMALPKRQPIPLIIRRLLASHATEAELSEAGLAFDDYMRIAWEIFERIERQDKANDSRKSRNSDTIEDAPRTI
jgi:hypothetical protein